MYILNFITLYIVANPLNYVIVQGHPATGADLPTIPGI